MQEKDNLELGLYVHVPFCASTCDFCAFYQEKPIKNQIASYLEGVEQELGILEDQLPCNTVFFGGGTPGLLAAKDLEKLCKMVLKKIQAPPQEWTVEMAPSVVKKDKLQMLKALGVTRISMGVQSFNPEHLGALGRLHNLTQIYTAYEAIQEVGFPSVNLDLMFAIPGQTLQQSKEDIQKAMALKPNHISTYCLTIEENTALYIKLSKGLLKKNELLELELYTQCWELLENGGYSQYEISNFAQKNHECIHNINTWNMQDWIGVGPSAASQFKKERFSNVSSTTKWLQSLEKKPIPRVDTMALTDTILASDACIFGLRMNKGINLDVLKKRFDTHWDSLEPVWLILEQNQLLIREKQKLFLTTKGRLLADTVGLMILEALQ